MTASPHQDASGTQSTAATAVVATKVANISGVDGGPQHTTQPPSASSSTSPSALHTIVSDELMRLGSGGPWVWKLFFLCAVPNILNGFHVSSYVFLGKMPSSIWCEIPALHSTNWTQSQINTLAYRNPATDTGCTILNYDYAHLATMPYEEALQFRHRNAIPADVSCLQTARVHYNMTGTSIVNEWNLICENSVWRTYVQVAVSFGKFVGASLFGIVSDRFGRKNSFTLGAISYTLGSLLTAFSPWYWPFVVGRVLLGAASSGLFYPALTILTENIGSKHRSWMSIAFTMSYPIGMILLAVSAHYIQVWQQLQLSLTIPAVFLLVIWCFMTESPRWLLSKNRTEDAYLVVFGHRADDEFVDKKSPAEKLPPTTTTTTPDADGAKKPQHCMSRFKSIFHELATLYGPARQRRMALTCHYLFCITSMSYYITVLNADNLAADKTVYVAAMGGVDLLGYVASIVALRYMGRKVSACLLFSVSAFGLLLMLAVPLQATGWIVFLAMFGRFGISSVYSIVTLHTAELFPTEIRGSALGACSTMAHIGSMTAPFIVDFLGQLAWFIPTTICGVTVFVAGLLTLTLPETRQRKLQDHCE